VRELLTLILSHDGYLATAVADGPAALDMAVLAMKAGAADFIEKPIRAAKLLASVGTALERSRDASKRIAWQESAAKHIGGLTPRQRQIMQLVLANHSSKNIAADLGISQRTVENHRAAIMKTTETKSLPALARLALAGAVATEDRVEHRPTKRTHPLNKDGLQNTESGNL